MLVRIASALVALPIALVLIHLGGWWFLGLVTAVAYVCAHEFMTMAMPEDRLARGVLRGRPFAALMGALGPARGERLLRRLAGASRTHPAEPGPLLDRQRTWAGRWLGTEADVAVMGHVHHPGIVEVEGGCVVHLGGWDLDRTWCLVEDGVPRLVRADLPPGPPSLPGAD